MTNQDLIIALVGLAFVGHDDDEWQIAVSDHIASQGLTGKDAMDAAFTAAHIRNAIRDFLPQMTAYTPPRTLN